MELHEFIHIVSNVRGQMFHQALTYLNQTDDAEDVVQDALAKLWQMRNRIDNVDTMTHLASVIVKNTSLNTIRNRKTSVPIDSISNHVSQENPHLRLEEKESLQRLERIISHLPDKQRAVIHMRNFEQLSYSEIAQVLGTTESSVRAMICKARQSVLRQMKLTI